MKQKKTIYTEQSINYSFWFLVLIICTVPLAITTALYNQSDLPKNAALIFTGGVFLTVLILSIILSRPGASPKLYLNSRHDLFALGLLGAAILTAVFSGNSYISFWGQYQRQIGLNLYIYLVLIYFFTSAVLTDRKNITSLLLAIELTAAVIALYAILQELGADPFGIQPNNVKRPVSTLGNSVFVGGFLIMVLPVSSLNASDKQSSLLKYLLPLVILTGIIVSRTRSAYIAFGVQALVLILLLGRAGFFAKLKQIRVPVKTVVITGTVLFVLALLVLLFPDNKYIARVLSLTGEGSNPRLLLWRDSFSIFLKYPLFGPGLGMFPNAFEEFYSYELRYADTNRYFDHAHNNFLHALYTMGAVGFAAYVLFLFSQFRQCLKGFLNDVISKKERILYLSLFLMLSGYTAYGLTNFDDISILLYLFVFAAVIKSLRKDNFPFKINRANKLPIIAAAILLLFYLGYNTYASYMNLAADSHFLKGARSLAEQNFRECAEETNKAIYANENCSIYRYILALNVYRYASSNTILVEAAKRDLLEQALAEVIRAKKNYINNNDCDALRSLILFELGRKDEANKLRDSVLSRNSINTDYRVSLAYYYFNSADTALADEMIESVLNVVPGSVNALSAGAFFSIKKGEMEKARKYLDKIFERDPGNRSAKELMKFIK